MPSHTVSFFSACRRAIGTFFFSQMTPVVKIGRKRILRESDLLPLPARLDPLEGSDEVAKIARTFHDRPVRFLRALYATEPRYMALSFFYAALAAVASLGSAALVHAFLDALTHASGSTGFPVKIFALALAFAAVGFCALLFPQQAFAASFHAYLRITGKVNAAIYRHSLRLPVATRSRRGVGDTVNLMGTDADAIGDSANMLPELLNALLVIVGAFAMLAWLLGPAVFAAILCFAFLIPLQKKIAGRFVSLDHALMAARDVRVERVSQILRGIRVVKFFGWRKSAADEISALREVELRHRRKLVWSEGASTFVFLLSSALVTIVTFYTHMHFGGTLTPAVAFASMTLFVSLEEPLSELSFYIASLVSARVSGARVGDFLMEEALGAEKHDRVVPTPGSSVQTAQAPVSAALMSAASLSTPGSRAPSVAFLNAGVRFTGAADDRAALDGFTLNVRAGESIAIVGPVGAGKTTLLTALLGEHPLSTGSVQVKAGLAGVRIGYVPQEAFVLNSSVRENILLGAPHESLAAAIHDSVLAPDLALFPAGVATEIGEQGVNLSGGQKQRLNLARAAAQDPTLVLLDDPLAAVDESTERLLCDRLVFGRWRKATRIVVTHRLSSLARFDRVAFMREGRLVDVGTHAELIVRCKAYQSFVRESVEEEKLHTGMPVGEGEKVGTGAQPAAAGEEVRQLTGEEALERGAVSRGTYGRYFRALGGGDALAPVRLALLAGVTLLAFFVPFLQRAWLSAWTEKADVGVRAKVFLTDVLAPYVQADGFQNLLLFSAIGVVGFCVVFAERVAWLGSGLTGGRVVHAGALKGVLGAPLRFFDSTPQGRILNRFSRDMDAVDRQLPWGVSNACRAFANVAATLAVIVALFPLLLVVAVPVAFVFLRVQGDYRASAREIKRMDARARSPVFAHYKETLAGLVEVRAHSKEDLFFRMFAERLRESVRLSYNHVLVNRWFAVRIPIVTVSISVGISLLLAYAAWKGLAGPGLAGLVLTYSSLLWSALSHGVRSFAEMESRLTGVERLFEYGDTVPESDTTVAAGEVLDENAVWPTRGDIVFEGVSVRYAEGDADILSDVSLKIPAGAKVGVVGRTGAGKSTLFQTLFRFLEPVRGEIRIDGVPLGAVPLDRLRQSLAIIPQDPVLFAGTLRENLDRFARRTDEDLWFALAAAHLSDTVESLPGGLSFVLSENGSNLSQGQRQMVCLARALLIDAKIILLDEATASVDVRTDALMQETLRTHCRETTVLVIAHRLETLEACDFVVELSAGRVLKVEDRRGLLKMAPGELSGCREPGQMSFPLHSARSMLAASE